MPAQWGISESHQLNEACEVPFIMRHHLTPFRSASLFWPALLRHFLCLPVCSFHLFPLTCRLYGFTQDRPRGLWASARVTGLNATKHSLCSLCPAMGTLCVPLVLYVSEHLAVLLSLISDWLLDIYFLIQHWLLSGEQSCVCKGLSLDSCSLAELYCVSVVVPLWN